MICVDMHVFPTTDERGHLAAIRELKAAAEHLRLPVRGHVFGVEFCITPSADITRLVEEFKRVRRDAWPHRRVVHSQHWA